jgi:tRNA(fMet)-specific endonuclease VapC
VAEPAFLLDSNICIYVLGDAASAAAIRLSECVPGSAVTSAIVHAELLRKAPEAADFEAFFDVVPVLPFDSAAARAYAAIPFKRGTFDRLIGAHALSRGLTLVTNNVRDYDDIPGLRLENWIEA